jgi:membrane-bound lytic murein transglycosylase D
VLASYNSGPGNVSKAIRRSGGQQNYWNIRKNLPKETQGYVPAFLATMYIYEYHKEHGIHPDRALIKHFATDTIMIKKQMSFKQIADLLDISVAQLQLLNPSYKINVIPSYTNKNHYLRLPLDKIAVFTSNENQIYAYVQHELNQREKPFQPFQVTKTIAVQDSVNYTTQRITLPKIKYYKVKRGDNLSAIASKYEVSVLEIKQWNKLKSNSLVYGKSLKIITDESVVRTVKKESKPNNSPSVTIKDNKQLTVSELKNTEEKDKKSVLKDSVFSNADSFYTVQKGDNLNSIAKKFNVSIAEIQEWNHLANANIQLGTSLQIVKKRDEKEEIVSAPERKNIEYVVQKGDNLGNIAKKFGATLSDIKQWNNLTENTIALGSTLIVAKNELAITTNKVTAATFKKKDDFSGLSKKQAMEYYVKKGDSLYSISKKYPGVTISDLKKWNGIQGEELKPGMKLKISG